jgi:hypothetical protein
MIALAPGACVRAPSGTMPGGQMSTDARALTIRFDNMARERVHVYLIGAQHAWYLGRVEAEAVVRLRIPDAALNEGSTMVRLVALAGERVTLEAARRASALTASLPASALLSQRWRFSRGELVSWPR